VIYQITPRLGVGVGAGYLRGSRTSRMSISEGTTTLLTVSGGPTLSAVPLRLGLFYNTPLSGKLDLVAGLGGDYYAAFKFESVTRLEYSPTEWNLMTYRGSSSSNLGFRGSLGLEYKLSPTMGVFVEAVGRYARFGNFDSITVAAETEAGPGEPVEAKLYLMTATFMGEKITIFQPLQTAPPPDTAETSFIQPKFDLSGFSLQAGVRIRF